MMLDENGFGNWNGIFINPEDELQEDICTKCEEEPCICDDIKESHKENIELNITRCQEKINTYKYEIELLELRIIELNNEL